MQASQKMRDAIADRVRLWSDRVQNAELVLMAAKAADRPMQATEALMALKTARRILARAQRINFYLLQGNLFDAPEGEPSSSVSRER
jgi:hypothetical protein